MFRGTLPLFKVLSFLRIIFNRGGDQSPHDKYQWYILYVIHDIDRTELWWRNSVLEVIATAAILAKYWEKMLFNCQSSSPTDWYLRVEGMLNAGIRKEYLLTNRSGVAFSCYWNCRSCNSWCCVSVFERANAINIIIVTHADIESWFPLFMATAGGGGWELRVNGRNQTIATRK